MFEVGSNWYIRGELGVSFDRRADNLALEHRDAAARRRRRAVHDGSRNGLVDHQLHRRPRRRVIASTTICASTRPGTTAPARAQRARRLLVCPYGLTGVSSPTAPYTPLGYLYNTSNTCNGTTKISQYNNIFLANGYVDLGTYAGFTPYVGGGLGFNMNVMSGSLNTYETANGLPYAANLTPIGAYPQIWVDPHGNAVAPQPSIAFAPQNWSRSISSTTYSFAWALSAGLGFQLNPSTTLDVGYRYLNSGQITTAHQPANRLDAPAKQRFAAIARRHPLRAAVERAAGQPHAS